MASDTLFHVTYSPRCDSCKVIKPNRQYEDGCKLLKSEIAKAEKTGFKIMHRPDFIIIEKDIICIFHIKTGSFTSIKTVGRKFAELYKDRKIEIIERDCSSLNACREFDVKVFFRDIDDIRELDADKNK